MTYLFKTITTMKEYNNKKWWIDSKIISDLTIEANTVNDALKDYQSIIKDKFYIEISKNALKNKSPMYITINNEDKQIGFVITAKTEFEDRDNYKWSTQYIELWVTIKEIRDIFN